MRSASRFLIFVGLLVALGGCTRAGAAFGAGILLGAVLAGHSHHHSEPREEVVVVQEPPEVVYVEALPPRATPPEPERRPFDAMTARSSLRAVDLEPCAARGAPHGHGHARVVFAQQGNVTEVTIDAPEGLPPDAVACIGERLGRATVPPFDGSDVAAGITFHVR